MIHGKNEANDLCRLLARKQVDGKPRGTVGTHYDVVEKRGIGALFHLERGIGGEHCALGVLGRERLHANDRRAALDRFKHQRGVFAEKQYECISGRLFKSEQERVLRLDRHRVRVAYDVDLAIKVVWVDVDIAAKIADRFNADACFAVRADLDEVGAGSASDIAAVAALAAGKRGGSRVRAVFADESLCKLERKRMLARAVGSLDDIGVRQIGIFGQERPRKSRAKLLVSDYLRKDLLQCLTSFQNSS